jgi:two-component system NtrC family response regulator
MTKFNWPGNVRELENKIKRAVVMVDGPIVEPADLGFVDESSRAEVVTDQPPKGDFGLSLEGLTIKEARGAVERHLLVRAMEQHSGNISRAAEILGLTRPTFYDLLKKHGLFVSGE